MFGIRKKVEKQMREILAQMREQAVEFEEKADTIEEKRQHMHTDVGQVLQNTSHLMDYAAQNTQEETFLLQEIDEIFMEMKVSADAYRRLAKNIKEHQEKVTNLVEENKHFTTPSKYLTEIPAKIRKEYKSYETKLDVFAEKGRQMSMMALNAAIEAGRMGDAALQLVAVSEEIRQTASECEMEALSMKEELHAAEERIRELEDVVVRLVSLMKENNVAATKLRKNSTDLDKQMSEFPKYDFTEDVSNIRAKVITVRNLDEEILKVSERNNIQMSDIQQELQEQKTDLQGLKSNLSDLFDEERLVTESNSLP